MSRAARLAYRTANRTVGADRLDWSRHGRDWPNRAASRFVSAGGLNWHVQQAGHGPIVLLVHGTGASTHSWGALIPLLARRFTVVAFDLPGHGFTDLPSTDGLTLPGMARSVAALLDVMGIHPDIAVGHSAGAAILARMCIDGRINPATLVSLNGAFLPLRGLPVQILSPVTRLLVALPAVPRMVARVAAGEGAVRRLLDDTGSKLSADQIAFYRRLFSTPNHVAAALGMMANWRLEMLEADLSKLPQQLVLIAAEKDGMIPPADASRIRARLPTARIVTVPGLGHLAHEEDPEMVAGIIEPLLERPRRRARS